MLNSAVSIVAIDYGLLLYSGWIVYNDIHVEGVCPGVDNTTLRST